MIWKFGLLIVIMILFEIGVFNVVVFVMGLIDWILFVVYVIVI